MTKGSRRLRQVLAGVTAAGCAAVALGAGAGSASAATTWLCKPGRAVDPCAPGLSTTQLSATGEVTGTAAPKPTKNPKIDCFYVYPTVSDQKRPQADLHVDPEQRSIALYQASRYSSECRVYAPMYRQVTLQGLLQPATVTDQMRATGYADVRTAWRDYLKKYNKGRGVVLVGHSQGTFLLRRLVAEEIDPRAAERRRLVSAVLLGGNVLVKQGKDVGGDFRTIRACRSATQVGCVIAFSTFNDAPPANPVFGMPSNRFGAGPQSLTGLQVLCSNPAALGGGAAALDTIEPAAPFAPGTTIGALTTAIGIPPSTVGTTWVEYPGAYTGRCSTEGGASVLRISGAVPGAPVLKALPDATWGLHLVDANIALGDLVGVVHRQAAAYAKR